MCDPPPEIYIKKGIHYMKKLSRIVSLTIALVMILSCVIAGTVSAEEQLYSDVKTKRWSYEDIKFVTEKGLMNGTTADKFAPAETMTRGMVVTVLYRMEGSPATEYKSTFSDVKAGKWFTDAVIWASEKEIVNGMGDGKFAPGDGITREQLATIIMRYSEFKEIITDARADITGYADYKRVHDYAKDALSWANAIGLITGVTEETLAPREGATREQFAAILHRFADAEFEYNLVYNAPKLLSSYTEPDYPLVTDADFYVAVDGDDSNPGSLDKPFATFEKAVEAVRELKKTKTEGGIKVAFKAGDYGKLSIALAEEDSGTEACPITYCAYGDGDVTFTNGETIKFEDFEPISEEEKALFFDQAVDHIYKADLTGKVDPANITEYSEVISGSERWYTARYPNMNGDSPRYAQYLTGTGDKTTAKLLPMLASRVEKYHTLEGMVIGGRLQQEWMTDTFNVASYDAETDTVTFAEELQYGVLDLSDTSKTSHWFGGYVGGVTEELDSPREYFIIEDTMTLYAYEPTDDLVFTTNGTFIHINADYINLVCLDFKYSTGGTIEIRGSNNVVDRCDQFGIGGHQAMYIFEGAFNCTVKNCEISVIAGTGIAIQDYGGATLRTTGHLITNNYIHDYAQIRRNYVGIQLQANCNGVTVSHNEIANAPHFAIQGGFYGNTIEYNYIHNVMMEASDGGAIYNGRSHICRDNVIRHNLFANFKDTAFAVYLDDGLSGYNVYGNIFYNIGDTAILAAGGRDNYICDNVYINTRSGQTRALWGWDKYGAFAQSGPIDSDAWEQRYATLNEIPTDPALLAIWQERWPTLFGLHVDYDRMDEASFEPNPANCVMKNNYAFGNCDNSIEELTTKFGTVENNVHFTLEDNPIFVNPALGNYSIKEDADFLDIQFEKIGRY